MQSHPVENYQIGIICALAKELRAVKAVLDEEHAPLKTKDGGDHNSYVLGRVGEHNVVAAGLPSGVYGTTPAALVGRDMLRTFPQLRFGLLVGIAGGIPDIQANRDIRLGDVVVGQPEATHGGVVQFDLGKLLNDGQFVRKGSLNKPPQTLLTALTTLQADRQDAAVARHLEEVDRKKPRLKEEGYHYRGTDQDQLHCSICDTSRWWWMLWVLILWLWPLWRCEKCHNGLVIRKLRPYTTPVVHYGTIASGNTLFKNAVKRDLLAKELGALCVEMEAAGLDDYPCLVIRGICDYADVYKYDDWQEYAALTAAAFMKVLLGYISPQATREERLIRSFSEQIDHHFELLHEHNTRTEEHQQRQEIHYQDDRSRACHRVFDTSDYERRKNINSNAVPGTCRWVLDHPRYREWFESKTSDLLWISADPGCGKSVLSKSLVDDWLVSLAPGPTSTQVPDSTDTICYFFFKDNEEQSSLSMALCAILHQLFSRQPNLIHHALATFDSNSPESLTTKVDALWRILQSATADASVRPVICVLDALDECRDADRQRLIDLLCGLYQDSRSSSRPQGCLKWLVTSRPHDDIQGYFGRLPSDLPSIRLRGEEENDQIGEEINLVIDQKITDLTRQLRLTSEKRQEVARQLHEMDNRTYLWLRLVLEHIEVAFKKSPRPNQVTISALPATVDQAYEDILKRITDNEERAYAKMVLTIIVGAARPLSIAEMALAFDVATLSESPRCLDDLTIDASGLGEKIRRWCGLFVFIKHDQLYLIHQTAKEFLLGHSDEPLQSSASWKHCLHPLHVNQKLVEICVSFLCLSDFNTAFQGGSDWIMVCDDDRGDSSSNIETFYAFAAEHWARHAHVVESDLNIQIQSKNRMLYDPTQPRFTRLIRILWQVNYISFYPGRFDFDNVHLASCNGHYLALEHILRTNPRDINKADSMGRTALDYAASRGRMETVELLLSQPNIDVNLGHPLQQAIDKGHKEIVELLLSQPNIDVNLGQPLCWAAEDGRKEIVELLLSQPNIDVNFGKPLCGAARSGHKEIIELLLSNPNIDVNLGEPFVMIDCKGYKEKVKLLLAQSGADVNLKERTSSVIENSYEEKRATFRARPDLYTQLDRPLYCAALSGHHEIVELLLSQPGIDIDREEVLYRAALSKSQNTIELLLARFGIDASFEELLEDVNTDGSRYLHPAED